MSKSVSDSHTVPLSQESSETVVERQWHTVVHNDPVNLMTYVQWVFESYFGMTPTVARARMLVVHRDGRAVVATGGRESMERHVQAMHAYGIHATLEQEG